MHEKRNVSVIPSQCALFAKAKSRGVGIRIPGQRETDCHTVGHDAHIVPLGKECGAMWAWRPTVRNDRIFTLAKQSFRVFR